MANESRALEDPMPARARSHSSLYLNLFISFIYASVVSIVTLVVYLIKLPFEKDKDVRGKVVLITGTGRGFGRDVALRLAQRGAILACVDINPTTNQETVDMIRSEGGRAEAFTVNIAKAEQVRDLAQQVKDRLGPVDILVNNAALILVMKFDLLTEEDIRTNFEVNCMGCTYMVKYFLPDMKKRNSGQVVTISSLAALMPVPYLSLYCSTKAALLRVMEALKQEMDVEDPGSKVVFSTVYPYFTNTSADYMRMLDSRIGFLEQEDVVRGIMYAILREKENVVVPWYMSLTVVVESITPNVFKLAFMKNLKLNFKFLSRDEWNKLPYQEILANTMSNKKS